MIRLAFLFLSIWTISGSAAVYKYKDAQGNWHFSDKKPEVQKKAGREPLRVEQLKFEKKAKKSRPSMVMKRKNGKIQHIAINPLWVPVQFFLCDEHQQLLKSDVVPPLTRRQLYSVNNANTRIRYRYLIGDPDSLPSNKPYVVPFQSYKSMKISQGFHGVFSHNHVPSLYAVDIAMPVGTKLLATRAGIVFEAKDDYPMGGVSSPFFLDKANVVRVVHKDGTYATYAHLLLGGLRVRVGDHVKKGQLLGLSGSTGYSSGPHLHFVIQRNNHGHTESVPFSFVDSKGESIKVTRGQWLPSAEHNH